MLLIFSGLISGSEVALFSLSKSQLKKEDNSGYIQIIRKSLTNPNKLLATILIANSFINIAIVILFTQIGNVIFKNITSSFWQFIIEVVVATFLILLFGEILPKGEYTLVNDILNKEEEELSAKKGDKVVAFEDEAPVDTILGIEIFSVVHMKTREKIYVSLEDIKE